MLNKFLLLKMQYLRDENCIFIKVSQLILETVYGFVLKTSEIYRNFFQATVLALLWLFHCVEFWSTRLAGRWLFTHRRWFACFGAFGGGTAPLTARRSTQESPRKNWSISIKMCSFQRKRSASFKSNLSKLNKIADSASHLGYFEISSILGAHGGQFWFHVGLHDGDNLRTNISKNDLRHQRQKGASCHLKIKKTLTKGDFSEWLLVWTA